MLKVVDQPNFNLGPVAIGGQTWDVEWVPIDDPEATTQSYFSRALGAGRRAVPPARGCVVGRPRRATSSRPTAASAREGQVFEYDPADRDAQADLRLADRQRSRQPRQHHGDAARRPAALRGQRHESGSSRTASASSASRSTATRSPSPQNNINLTGRLQRSQVPAGQLPAERMGRRLLQPGRPVAVRQHPDARHHVRDHRPVGTGAALRAWLGARGWRLHSAQGQGPGPKLAAPQAQVPSQSFSSK